MDGEGTESEMSNRALLPAAAAVFAVLCVLSNRCVPAAEIPRIGLQHQIGDAPGFEENYSRVQAFVPLFGRQDNWLVFGDAQGMIDNRGALSNSIGFGFRFAPDSAGRIFGIHTHYDYREFDFARGDFDFHRWGAGVEAIGELWAARANVYVNASGRQLEQRIVDPTPPQFVDRFLQLGVAQSSYVEAFHGTDFELGRLLPQPFGLPIDHEVTVGGYYWDTPRGDGHHAPGVKTGLHTWWSESLVTYVQATYDRVFESSVNGGFVWYFGGPSTRPSARAESLAARMATPIRRQYEIPVLNYRDSSRSAVFATNAATGERITFAHVDDDAAPGGSGTWERPLSRLQEASQSPADVVLVQNGIYRNDFIALSPGQRLLAANVPQFVETAERGLLQLPGTGIGGASTILGAPRTAIILASNTEVVGFAVADPLHHGIFGESISNVQIRKNVVTGAGVNGISVGSLGGFGIFEENRILENDANGLQVVAGNAQIAVMRNVVQGSGGHGIVVNGNEIVAAIEGNISKQNVRSGLEVGARSRLIGDIANNQTNGNGQYGIHFSSDGVLDGSVIGNTANGNGARPGSAPGIWIRSLRGITGSISHNTAHRNASTGIGVVVMEGRIGGDVVNNFATDNRSGGIVVAGRDGVGGEVSGNVANRNDFFGMRVGTSGRIGGRVANNMAADNVGFGINIGSGGGLRGDVSGNIANRNALEGFRVWVIAEPDADYSGNVLDNVANENGTTGFEFRVADDFAGRFTNNTANRNGRYGFDTFAGGTVTGLTSGNTAVGNALADFNGNIAQP